MSETPRTDNNIAFTDYMTCGEPLVYTYASFSRKLETELAEARAEIERKNEELNMFLAERQAMNEIIERKNALIEQMREIFQNIVDHPGHPDFTKNEIHSMQMLATEGICAAERGEMTA